MGRVRTIPPLSALIAPIAIVALALCATRALAWGDDGHRISAHIASSLLTESARRDVRALFGHDDLPALATELDHRRDDIEARHPGAARWHYENRSVCTRAISCPRGACVTKALEKFIGVLADIHASREQRKEALTIVMHLLGDLHQPLHLADNDDRGGNDSWVRLPNERDARRLHEVWDTQLVRRNLRRRSAGVYAHALLAAYGARGEWRSGSVETWAQDTHRIGANAYRALPDFACAAGARIKSKPIALSEDYLSASQTIVAEQLVKAGVRIAEVLNRSLPR